MSEVLDVKKGSAVLKVPFGLLVIQEGLNIRTDYGDIKELAANIRENGVKQPFRGYKKDGMYVVTDGHRRHAACALLAEDGSEIVVPFITESAGYNDEQRVVDMFIMNSGKDLTLSEKAAGIKRLINYGWEIDDVAKKLSHSKSYIARLLMLEDAPKAFKKLINKGIISDSYAIELLGKGDAQKFLDDYQAGVYDQTVNAALGEGEEGAEGEGDGASTDGKKPKKITKADVKAKEINSVRDLKKFIQDTDADIISEDRADAFAFLGLVFANELDAKKIAKWFK